MEIGGAGGGGPQYNPRTVEEVFRDFKGRRAALIKALTTGLSLPLTLSLSHSPPLSVSLFRNCHFVFTFQLFIYLI